MKIPRKAENSSKPIFISHAATDKAIADSVVDLLNTAMGVDVQNAVFCTSLEGLKIPPGKDFKDFVKEQIQHPKIVMLLISQNYLASQFCLAELGASWAMSHRMIPFLIPPVTFDDLKAVLTNVHVLKIEDRHDWNEALEAFKETLDISPNVNRWERKRDDQLEKIKSLIPKQKAPPIVPLAKLQAAEEKATAANQEIEQLEKENARLRDLYEKTKHAKDAGAVARIELESLPAGKRFRKLLTGVKSELKGLPAPVCEALYYYYRGEYLQWPGFGDDDKRDEMVRAVERELLDDLGDEGVKVNTAQPRIARSIEALGQLQRFVDRDAEEIAEAYEEEHDEPLSFTSRDFWERHLL